MKRIGMGIVGAGFVGPHHVDAVRRLGFVDVVGVAGSTEASAKKKAEAIGARKAFGSYEALLDDPEVQVVHNATPNYLHYPVNAAALARGKHVVSDKPLAMSAKEAKQLVEQARKAGVVNAVTFNYRGNPLVQQARLAVKRGDLGKPNFLVGYYLQDWLIKDTDYSWRLEPDKGGASSAVADIGSHWCDLVQHVTGLRIESVLADLATVVPIRYKPHADRVAFTGSQATEGEPFSMRSEDLATILVRFEGNAKGVVSVGQVCAGHKNDLWFEVSGATGSLRWRQEAQNELWIGRRDEPNMMLAKDPSLLTPEARGYARLPGGHQEGWPDAFLNVLRDVYSAVARQKAGEPVGVAVYPTFEDGYRVACLIDAVLESHHRGGVWTAVQQPALAGVAR